MEFVNPRIAKAQYTCTKSYKLNYNLKTTNDKDLTIFDISNWQEGNKKKPNLRFYNFELIFS